MRKTVTETGKLIDIGEYLKKFDISTVSSRDTSAETGSIDTDARNYVIFIYYREGG